MLCLVVHRALLRLALITHDGPSFFKGPATRSLWFIKRFRYPLKMVLDREASFVGHALAKIAPYLVAGSNVFTDLFWRLHELHLQERLLLQRQIVWSAERVRSAV